MPENEISTEYVPDDDDAQSYVEFLEQEMARVKEKLKYSIPGTEEYLNASQAFEKISTAYRNLFDHYYSEEPEPADAGEKNREKRPSFYAEEEEESANKRKGKFMNNELKLMKAHLEKQMANCIALMDQCQCGSDEYNELEEKRLALAREHFELSKFASEQNERRWDKAKWIVNAAITLLGIGVPIFAFGHYYHQGLDFESTGAYRSRGVSNLANKMVPKELQF